MANEAISPRLRVLVIEDEFLVALLVEEMLEAAGFDVVGPVSRLAMAEEAAARDDFDVALLDVNVGGEPVFPLASLLAERGIPLAFVTGYGREELTEEFRERPMLCKPFGQDDLAALIRQAYAARANGQTG